MRKALQFAGKDPRERENECDGHINIEWAERCEEPYESKSASS